MTASPSPLEKLLQRYARFNSRSSSSSCRRRPPDVAASALGREIALSMAADEQAAVWRALSSSPGTLSHSFFHTLMERMQRPSSKPETTFEWIPVWMFQMEQLLVTEQQGGGGDSAAAPLRGLLDANIHACIVYFGTTTTTPHEPNPSTTVLLDSYKRLELESSKMSFLRAILQSVFERNAFPIATLTPLLVWTLLVRNNNNKVAVLQLFWHAICKTWHEMSTAECRLLLDFMTACLMLHLDRLPNVKESERWADLELAESWLLELSSLAESLQQAHPDDNDLLADWFRVILCRALPRLAAEYRDVTHLLKSLQAVLDTRTSSNFLLDNVTTFRLSTWTLTTPDPVCRCLLIEFLNQGVSMTATSSHMLKSLCSIFAHDPDLAVAISSLQRRLKAIGLAGGLARSAISQSHLIDHLERDKSVVVDTLVKTASFANTDLTATQQVGSLLFGIVLWNDVRREKDALRFLGNLLEHYPHLGISLLPIVIDRINETCIAGDGPALLEILNFLCASLVGDPHCAQEIWNLVGIKMTQNNNIPLAVRVMMIRMFPKLCSSNKRLYRRVMEAVGVCMASREPEIRLAVAVTLADLTTPKGDLIQDVSDVISWIQKLLMEDRSTAFNELIVHYAIMALHNLVVAQELVFDVVIKVLNKRLCPVADVDAILQLPYVVLEALVLLLGDGECESSSSSDDAEQEEKAEKPRTIDAVSPQVSLSVRTLLELGTRLDWNDNRDKTLARVRRNICFSLSRLSLDALGLTEEGIKSVVGRSNHPPEEENPSRSHAAERYMSIRNVATAALWSKADPRDSESEADPVTALARKVVAFEEESLGSTLWPGKGPALPRPQQTIDQSLALLTDQMDVRAMVADRRTPGAAIAALFAADGSQLSVIRDFGDACLDSSDPLFIVFAVQAYLQVSVQILTKQESISQMLTEIGSWYEVFVSPDTMYLSFACVSLYMPPSLREEASSTSTYAEELCDAVLDAYKSQRFQKDDVSKICLGLSGVSFMRCGSLQQTTDIVDMLEQSVRGYGGRQTFGAYYGLALICQGAEKFMESEVLHSVRGQARRLVYRICGFLVEELLPCYEDRDEIFSDLLKCLKTGVATQNLVESMSELEANSISLLMTKAVTARYLFISCAICLPTLASLDSTLLLATLRMMEAFEWGGGKGIALPPMLKACRAAQLFRSNELKQIYTEFAIMFEERMDSEFADTDDEGLDDLFYAFNGTSSASTSHIIRRTIVGNRDLFVDDDGSTLSLIAMAVAIVPIPCLGGSYFALPPELTPKASAADTRSIVGIAMEAAGKADGSKDEHAYTDMAAVLLGLFSCVKRGYDNEVVSRALPAFQLDSDTEMNSIATKTSIRGDADSIVDQANLPCPQSDTVLWSVLNIIEPADESEATRNEWILTRAIAVLEALSLPGPFSKAFIEPLMKLKRTSILGGVLSLLCSQLRGRRRALYDGADFSRSAVQVLKLPLTEWCELNKGTVLKDFVASLSDITTKFPSDSTESALSSCWQNCASTGSKDLIVEYLSTMKHLLGSTAWSPKTTNAVRNVFISKVAKTLLKTPLDALIASSAGSGSSLLDAFTKCLQELPHSMLDDNILRRTSTPFDNTEPDMVKILCVSNLIESGYITASNGRDRDLASIWTWIAKQLHSPKSVERRALNRLMCSFARNTVHDNLEMKRERFSNLLDLLLLTGGEGSRLGIQFLSTLLAFWNGADYADKEPTLGFLCTLSVDFIRWSDTATFDEFYAIFQIDLPGNLSDFVRRQNITGSAWNVLHRLYKRWTDESQLKVSEQLVETFRQCLFLCPVTLAQEDALVSLASSTITACINSQDTSNLSLDEL